MLLSDVVKVLGERTLGEFPWGCVVKDTVNLFAEEPLKLKLTSTGADVTVALGAMSDTNRELLANAQLDVNRSCVITPIGGGLDVVHGDGDAETAVKFGHFQALTALVVGVVMIVSIVMFSDLSINEKTDWKAIGTMAWSIVKTIGGF